MKIEITKKEVKIMNCAKCNTTLYRCKKCGAVGCKGNKCPNRLTKPGVSNICGKCGSNSLEPLR